MAVLARIRRCQRNKKKEVGVTVPSGSVKIADIAKLTRLRGELVAVFKRGDRSAGVGELLGLKRSPFDLPGVGDSGNKPDDKLQ